MIDTDDFFKWIPFIIYPITHIKNWSDVEREMIQLTGNNINMSGLKRQYKVCGHMLSVRGYSIDTAKL